MTLQTVQIDFWQLVGMAATLVGVFAALGKAFLVQMGRGMDLRFNAIEEARVAQNHVLTGRLEAIEQVKRDEVHQLQLLERELLTLKADLPLHYVRREDYIRGQAVIESKLDALYMKVENVQLRGKIDAAR